MRLAILFQAVKEQVNSYLEKYGQENIPPPSQLFTIPVGSSPGANVHLIQKVFEGAFQVSSRPRVHQYEVYPDTQIQFDILYSSASAPKAMTCTQDLTCPIPFTDRRTSRGPGS